MIFDYQESLSALPQRLTAEKWRELTTSEAVNRAVWDFQHGDANAKKRLPAVMWQASFGGKRRSNANAIPSGLYMLDLDHLEGNTAEIVASHYAEMVKCGVVLAHTTPSGHGLRYVAKMLKEQSFATIAEYQRWLAARLGFDESQVDESTKDLARMSFVPPFNYIHYCDNAMFVDEPEVTIKPEANRTPSKRKPRTKATQAASEASSAQGHENDAQVAKTQDSYLGIPLREIAQRLLENIFDYEIAEGNRNTSLYTMARLFRYVCDFNPSVMAANMPSFGLEAAEVEQICQSSIDSCRRSSMPPEVEQVVSELKAEREADGTDEDATDLTQSVSLSLADYQQNLPPLPPLFREFLRICPADFKAVQLAAMLPVVGTLCTSVRGTYLDGEEHSPSFITVVTAPQASGKSFARKMYNKLTHRIQLQDEANRAIEEAYRQELKRAKNAKEQPEDPHACVRLLPPSVSIAKLLQRLDNAKQKHLLTFAEEIDTLTKSNKSGAWAQKSDLYRNAFDNAAYGQDYMSDASYSTVVKVYYNLLILGTPRAVGRFFNDVEDGLVSRVLFCEIPNQAGKRMPKFGAFNAATDMRIDRLVEALMGMEQAFDLGYLNRAIDAWLEAKRYDFLRTQNMALEIFRRRAAVIGFRAGLVAQACYLAESKIDDERHPSRYTNRIKAFALWVANYTLTALLARFGEKVDEGQSEVKQTKVNYADIFSAMGDTFTTDDLRTLMKRNNVHSALKLVIHRWKSNDLVEKIEGTKNTYKKLNTQQK